MHPSWKIENMRRRVDRARKGPHITCPASRHLHHIADQLSSAEPGPILFDLEDDPKHAAQSIYAVVEALWKERAKNYAGGDDE